ncbi:MAG: YlbF family regulator [Planctomycetes bacterium]|nr:YlbF family regulator [Planctomycetota bacterium]
MADPLDEILEQATRLGGLIRRHPRFARLRQADDAVRADPAATSAMEAYNKAAGAIARKERAGQPVEVEEKRSVQRLHEAVAGNERIKGFMAAQADYAELMRRMNDTIFEAITADEAAGKPADRTADGPQA